MENRLRRATNQVVAGRRVEIGAIEKPTRWEPFLVLVSGGVFRLFVC